MNIVKLEIPPRQKILFFLLGYLSWFGCVLLAGTMFEILCITIVAMNFICAKMIFKKIDVKNWLKLSLIGIVFDQVAISTGIIHIPAMPVVPLWLVSLWLVFILSLPIYQSIFAGQFKKAAIVGAIAGPITYLGGSKFEVLYFSHPANVIFYAIFWALFFSWITAGTLKKP